VYTQYREFHETAVVGWRLTWHLWANQMKVIERQTNLHKLTGATVANFPTPVIQIIKQPKDNGSNK